MSYKIKSKKAFSEENVYNEKLNANSKQNKNPYFVDGKDVSQFPIYYLEGDYGLTEKQEIALWQYGVDTGIVWRLQGWYGRTAQDLLDAGEIHYPHKHSVNSGTDYYGNPIPTHEEAEKRGLYKK